MAIQNILDKDGSWFVNKGSFPFIDPTNGNRFEPETPTKAAVTIWVKSQPALVAWVDPEAKPVAVKPAPAAK